jgi:ParB family chromosome partitioning protein
MGVLKGMIESSSEINTEGARPKRTSTVPGAQMGGMAIRLDDAENRADQAEAEVQRLQAALETAKEQGGALQIPLTDLVEVPGRRRKLSLEAFSELRANLERHTLVTPITVRPLPDGKYEIVSGHNRTAAYRELGKDSIPAWPAAAEDSDVEELAFYANLLQPDLSALEKYRGLQRIKAQNPDLTVAGLAERTGLSRSVVGELMLLDDLPAAALVELQVNPAALGAKALSQLAALAKQGRAEQVVEAVKRAVYDGIEQKEAVRLAAMQPKVSAPDSKSTPVIVKAGRKNYCSIVGAKKVLRIEFQNEGERQEIEAELKNFLEQIAKRRAE